MTKSGIYLRDSVIDTAEVENMFVTPRSFLYYMNRISGEEWRKEQEKDENQQPPVTLDVIERGINLQSVDRMLTNESGRFRCRGLSDIDLCTIIDTEIVPNTGRKSVYELTSSERDKIMRHVCHTYSVSEGQASRCLASSYFKA